MRSNEPTQPADPKPLTESQITKIFDVLREHIDAAELEVKRLSNYHVGELVNPFLADG